MDDGEIEFPDRHVLADSSDPSMETILDEILKNAHSCTHTHTCNPPGPDNIHTHTCFHAHTQLFAPIEGKAISDQRPDMTLMQAMSLDSPCEPSYKRQTLANREAVRKYREKKKAHTAFLEEQVKELKSVNQQLLSKLQGQAALEVEVVQLRGILAEFRGCIDVELCPGLSTQRLRHETGSMDLSKRSGVIQPLAHGYHLNSCNFPCDADVRCLCSPIDRENSPSSPL